MQIINERKTLFYATQTCDDQQNFDQNVKVQRISLSTVNNGTLNTIDCSRSPDKFHSFIKKKMFFKTDLHKINLMSCGIRNLDFLQQKIERALPLPLRSQYTSKIYKNLQFLKQIILDNNRIQSLPAFICELKRLKTLKINNNLLQHLQYLSSAWILQAQNNPIKTISANLYQVPLRKIKLSWLSFIFQQPLSSSSLSFQKVKPKVQQQQVELFLAILKDIAKRQSFREDVTFGQFFNARLLRITEQQRPIFIIGLLTKAIYQEFDLFINWCLQYQTDSINFNALKFKQTLLLEYALQADYQLAISLFTKNKHNFIQNDNLLLQNLLIACKYSHFKLFIHLLSCFQNNQIIQNFMESLVSQLFCNFSIQKKSQQILNQLLKISKRKKIKIMIPKIQTKDQNQNTGRGLIYILTNNQIYKRFQLTNQQFQIKPLLQLSITIKNTLLIELLLFKLNFNVFNRNFNGKLARSVKGLSLNKKILYSRQNYLLNQHFQSNNKQILTLQQIQTLQSMLILQQTNKRILQTNKKILQSNNNNKLSQVNNSISENENRKNKYLPSLSILKLQRYYHSLYDIQISLMMYEQAICNSQIKLKQKGQNSIQNNIQCNPIRLKKNKLIQRVQKPINNILQNKYKNLPNNKQIVHTSKSDYLKYYNTISNNIYIKDQNHIDNRQSIDIFDQYQIFQFIQYHNFIEQNQNDRKHNQNINRTTKIMKIKNNSFCGVNDSDIFQNACCTHPQKSCINLENNEQIISIDSHIQYEA